MNDLVTLFPSESVMVARQRQLPDGSCFALAMVYLLSILHRSVQCAIMKEHFRAVPFSRVGALPVAEGERAAAGFVID